MPSQAYNEAVGARQRQTSAKIIFDIIDNTAGADATITANNESSVSRKVELVNNVSLEDASLKWATLEDGYFTLDGKNRVTPETSDIVSVDVGFWSDTLSDDNGEFTTPIEVTVALDVPHSSIGLSLVFDDEYATAFDIAFYDVNNDLILERNITNNASNLYVLNEPIDNYNKIVLTFHAVRNANRRLRLYEVIFGVTKIFTDLELINLDITRELNIVDEVLPSSDLNFTIDNLDKRFNILNPTGIYKYLQTKQLIRSAIGVYVNDTDIEYMDTGQYYLDEWETDGITASFTARDRLYFINDNLMYTVASNTTKSLLNWVTTLLELAGITDCIIDGSLSSISVTTRFDETSVKSLIKSACTAGNCLIYVDVNNIVNVLKIPQNRAGNIVLDNMYNYPKVKLDMAYNTVKVGVYNTSEKKVTSYVSVDNITNNDPSVVYEVADNPFITNNARATDVANRYLSILAHRELYDIDWRQNPALDINNIVKVEDNFGVNGDVVITKQEYNYAGYLSGRTEGRGINVANTED